MPATFGIVDLFAGPGGLGEGFASLRVGDHSPFQIGISVEKETSAHRTLTLRAFVRAHAERHGALPTAYVDFHAGQSAEPDWSTVDAAAWDHAASEARCLELGTEPAAEAIDSAIARLRKDFDDTILIGGPPCQAYSLVGRARANGKIGYVPEEDARHYLFREYIRVLDRLRPAAFVMENVKGMLSSTIESRMVPEALQRALLLAAAEAHDVVTHPPAGVRNMSEWAKQQACWNGMKGRTLDYDDDFETCLTLVETARTAKRDEKAKKAMTEGINAQSEVVTLGADFWKDLLAWGRERKRLTPKDQQILEVCASIPRRLPSDLQSRHALDALARMRDQGFGDG